MRQRQAGRQAAKTGLQMRSLGSCCSRARLRTPRVHGVVLCKQRGVVCVGEGGRKGIRHMDCACVACCLLACLVVAEAPRGKGGGCIGSCDSVGQCGSVPLGWAGVTLPGCSVGLCHAALLWVCHAAPVGPSAHQPRRRAGWLAKRVRSPLLPSSFHRHLPP